MAGDQTCQNLHKERYATKDDISVIPFRQPETIEDPLTAIAVFVEQYAEERLPDGSAS